MPEQAQRTHAQEINTWVQTTAIIIAALWGIYTFIYAQVLVPKSAPVNITVDLDLKKVGEGGLMTTKSNHTLIPVEMKISAKNPSPRQVFLLPSYWIAYGVKMVASTDEHPFKDALTITSQSQVTNVERHVRENEDIVVGYGGLVPDTVLKPNETATRSLIFYVPPNQYDSIRVYVGIPTMDREGAAELKYHFNEQTQALEATMYRIGPKGERVEMKRDKDGGYSDPKLELQQSSSEAELSLW
ncbi:MAG: hypothetical protein ABSD98_10160 [Candidatus Korobacteraceae bacterium]|jgi:hypothetical protein